MDKGREDHVQWFATESDRDSAGRLLPLKSMFGSVYTSVDSRALAREVDEMLDGFGIDASLARKPEMHHFR